jgi:hypothetical protein
MTVASIPDRAFVVAEKCHVAPQKGTHLRAPNQPIQVLELVARGCVSCCGGGRRWLRHRGFTSRRCRASSRFLGA